MRCLSPSSARGRAFGAFVSNLVSGNKKCKILTLTVVVNQCGKLHGPLVVSLLKCLPVSTIMNISALKQAMKPFKARGHYILHIQYKVYLLVYIYFVKFACMGIEMYSCDHYD